MGRPIPHPFLIVADDHVTSAAYALENNLIELQGWMQLRHIMVTTALGTYAYLKAYVADPLATAVLRPKEFTQLLIDKYKFKLNCTEPISLHLGCDLVRNSGGIFCLKPHMNIVHMEPMFGEM